MELEELKNMWIASSMQQKDFTLNEQLVKKMLQKKSNNALNKILNTQVFGLIILLLIIPFMVWALTDLYPKYKLSILHTISLTYWLVVSSISAILVGYAIIRLLQFDVAKPLSYNLKIINREKPSFMLRLRIVTYSIILIGFIPTFIINWQVGKVWLWVFFFAVMAICGLWSCLSYRQYNKNLESVVSGLEELEKLKELEANEDKVIPPTP